MHQLRVGASQGGDVLCCVVGMWVWGLGWRGWMDGWMDGLIDAARRLVDRLIDCLIDSASIDCG
jgi:hypothetical protein